MKKILILEDDSIQAFLISNTLKSNGYDILHFDTYELAASEIVNSEFDCYIVDINLGYEKTGIDFVEKIRQQNKKPIIITSEFNIGIDLHKKVSGILGYDLFELDEKIETNNIFFYSKPIELERLVKKMNEIL